MATELLSNSELCEIKAGKSSIDQPTVNICGLMCTSCMACTSCTSCTSFVMDVIVA